MRQITLHIPEKKYDFFMELVSSLPFIKKVEEEDAGDSKEEIIAGLKEAVAEIRLIRGGKKESRPAEALIHELRSQNH